MWPATRHCCEEQSGSVSGSVRAAQNELTWEKNRWLLVFNCHAGLPQTAYGKALTPNVAWSYLWTERRPDHCPSLRQICYTQPHVPGDPTNAPPSAGFLPAGPSHGSLFSCLVYSSSSTHNPLRAGGQSLAPLFLWVPSAAESRAGVELLHLGSKSSHQMWKVRVTHAEFYEDWNERTSFCPDFVVETLQYITETIRKKVKIAQFRQAVA